MFNFNCRYCKKPFEATSSKRKYCSHDCARKDNKTQFKIGHAVHVNSIGSRFQKGQLEGEDNVNWKGDKVGYWGLHKWIQRKRGKAKKCAACGGEKRIQWANLSHEYKRNVTDWKELCQSCHSKYDRRSGAWGVATKRFAL